MRFSSQNFLKSGDVEVRLRKTDRETMMKRIIPIILLAACTADSEEDTSISIGDPESQTMENTGYACIASDADDNHDTAEVTVVLSECLPSCSWNEEATCQASTEAGTVTVTAQGSYTVGYDETGVDCPAICIELSATCEADGLASGDFELSYAGGSVDFTGPVDETSCTGP